MDSYDYIIIGAGSAGCVLANRLSENPDNSVLLIEAGGKDDNWLLPIPGAYPKHFKKKIDWGFWTEPQQHVNNRKLYLPRGKVLGGCSSINAMAYVRGNKQDYNAWSKAGNKGWSFKDVLPYFIKSEHHEEYYLVDRGYHGKNGPINISFANKFITPMAKAFLEAGQEIGIPYNADYNGESQAGISLLQFTIKQEKRHSAATAFLKPVLTRGNLNVLTNTLVSKVNIEGDQATGVEIFKRKGRSTTVKANKEVIISSGSFNSPKLLMLSGIGDPDLLIKYQIQSVKHLPGVGKNLQDHLFCSVSALTHQQDGINHGKTAVNQLKNMIQYQFGKNGPLTIGVLEATAFLNLDDIDLTPNFQFQFSPMQPGKGYNYDLYDFKTFPVDDGFTILPSLVKPKSRGYVTLQSSDPLDDPIIQPNFFQHPDDLNMMVKGVKKAIEIMQQPAFDFCRKEIICPPDLKNDEAIIEHIKQSLETIYHPTGTCKMGKGDLAVVDHELKVHGIQGLRIADASIMPTIVTGNINAAVMMIAEKASDMILNE